MNFIFEPIKINRNLRYTLGKEATTNKYYLSFLVSPANHRYVEYEEYYEISLIQLNLFLNNEDELIDFLNKCKRREKDELLVFYPIAPIRGYPT